MLLRKWITLSIALLVLSAAAPFPFSEEALAASSDRSLYNKATARFDRLRKDVRKRRYRDQWEAVIKGFEDVAKRYPSSSYAGYAYFKRAQAVHGLYRVSRTTDDLRAAAEAYSEFARKYPDNENVPEALNKAGAIFLELGDKEEAAESYQALVSRFPKSVYSPSASERLKGLPRVEPEVRGAASVKGLSRVTDIRHWSNNDTTRVVIELEEGFTYEDHLIKAPDRLFFDIKGAFINSPLKDRPIDINDGILKAVRTSQYNSETVRVVLDIESVGNYNVLMLPDPPRLVVDVFASGSASRRERPLMTSGEGPGSGKQGQTQAVRPVPKDALSLARQMGLCVATIVVDPGHGGKDSGAVGRKGLKEKEVVLDIGRRLSEVIKRELGCKVIMTRDRDVFIELDARPMVARNNDADLFISIHANASRNRKAKGVETYLLNLTKDRGIMEVAARENATTMKKMSDLNSILFDLVLDNKREESLDLAHMIQNNLVKDLKVNDKGVKQGPFLVLYGASVPSILTEVGFISNPEEEKLLGSAGYRQKVAEAIFSGIRQYIDTTRVASYKAAM